jgi:hypothetical protein
MDDVTRRAAEVANAAGREWHIREFPGTRDLPTYRKGDMPEFVVAALADAGLLRDPLEKELAEAAAGLTQWTRRDKYDMTMTWPDDAACSRFWKALDTMLASRKEPAPRWNKEVRHNPSYCWALVDTKRGVDHSLHFFERECDEAVARMNKDEAHTRSLAEAAARAMTEVDRASKERWSVRRSRRIDTESVAWIVGDGGYFFEGLSEAQARAVAKALNDLEATRHAD